MNVKHLHGTFEALIKTKKEHKQEQYMFVLSCCFGLAMTLKQFWRLNPLNRSAVLFMEKRVRWWMQIMLYSLHNFHDWLITVMISENKWPPIKFLTRWQGIWCKQFSMIECQCPNPSMFGQWELIHDKGRSCWGVRRLRNEASELAGFTDTDCGLITNGRSNGSVRMLFLTVDSNETDEWSCRDYLAIHPA